MYVEHGRAVSRPLSLASVRRARWSISSTLLESHLIRSQRDLIEHSAAVCAPGPAERGARPRRERAPPPHKRFFLLPPSRPIPSNFSLCPFCWSFHILLFSGWINFNLDSKTSIQGVFYFLSFDLTFPFGAAFIIKPERMISEWSRHPPRTVCL